MRKDSQPMTNDTPHPPTRRPRRPRRGRLQPGAGLPGGSWQPDRQQTSETFTTMAAARSFRNKIRRQRDEGLVLDAKAGMSSVADYTAIWLARAEVKRETT